MGWHKLGAPELRLRLVEGTAWQVKWSLCKPCLSVAMMETTSMALGLPSDGDQVCESGSGIERRDAPMTLPALDPSRGMGTLWDPVEEGASVGISGHVSGQPSPDSVLIPRCRC